MLTCTKCKSEKPETKEFFPPHNGKKNGLDSWCRSCRNEYRTKLRVPPGILKEEYQRAYDAKDVNECVICGSVKNIVVDHDHKTQKVRGPLCQHCNFGLGHFRDDPELLELAAMYLRGECACGKCETKWGGSASFVAHSSVECSASEQTRNGTVNG